jgi:hypothetical protein
VSTRRHGVCVLHAFRWRAVGRNGLCDLHLARPLASQVNAKSYQRRMQQYITLRLWSWGALRGTPPSKLRQFFPKRACCDKKLWKELGEIFVGIITHEIRMKGALATFLCPPASFVAPVSCFHHSCFPKLTYFCATSTS